VGPMDKNCSSANTGGSRAMQHPPLRKVPTGVLLMESLVVVVR